MDVREKLVELLEPHMSGLACEYESGSCELTSCRSCNARNIADHLIENGVTVQEWVSVKDELPKEQGYYRVYHKNSKSISDRFYYKDCPDLFVNVMDDPITYWKPIEQPPKGE